MPVPILANNSRSETAHRLSKRSGRDFSVRRMIVCIRVLGRRLYLLKDRQQISSPSPTGSVAPGKAGTILKLKTGFSSQKETTGCAI